MYSLSYVISRSLKLAWQHKILWILALLIGGMSFNSGGGGGNNSNNYDDKDNTPQMQRNYNQESTKELNSNLEKVLGVFTQSPNLASIDSSTDYVGGMDTSSTSNIVDYSNINSINSMYASDASVEVTSSAVTTEVPPFVFGVSEQAFLKEIISQLNYLYLGLFVLVIFIFGTLGSFIMFFLASWSLGALIGGINDAIYERPYTLRELGAYGRRSTKELFKYRLLLALVTFLIGILIAVSVVVLVVKEVYILILPLILVCFPFFIFMLLLGAADKFTVRYVALKGLTYIHAVRMGIRYLMRNFLKYLLLSIANCFVVGLLAMVIIAALIAGVLLVILPLIGIDPSTLSAPLIFAIALFAVPFFLLLVVVFTAFTGYIGTYKNFTWSMFFNYGVDEPESRIKDLPVNLVNPTPITVNDGGTNGNQ